MNDDNKINKFSNWFKVFKSILLNNIILMPIFFIIICVFAIDGIGDPDSEKAVQFVSLVFIAISEYLCHKVCLKYLNFNKIEFKKDFIIAAILNILVILVLIRLLNII